VQPTHHPDLRDASSNGGAAQDALQSIRDAILDDDLGGADRSIEALARNGDLDLDDPQVRALRALILIRRDEALEALQLLNHRGDDESPELRVLCLYALADPYWVGLARELVESSADETVRWAMRQLLLAAGLPV